MGDYLPLPERLLWIAQEVDQLAALTGPNAPPGFVEALERREWWTWYASSAVELAAHSLDCALYPRRIIGRNVPLEDERRRGVLYETVGWPDIVEGALFRLDDVLTDLFSRWEMADVIAGKSWNSFWWNEEEDSRKVPPTVNPEEYEALLWISRVLFRAVSEAPDPPPGGWLAMVDIPRDVVEREVAIQELLWEQAIEEERSIIGKDSSQLQLTDLADFGPFRCSKRKLARALGRKSSDIPFINKLVDEERLTCEKSPTKWRRHYLYDFRFTASGRAYLEERGLGKAVASLVAECIRPAPASDNPSDNPDPGE